MKLGSFLSKRRLQRVAQYEQAGDSSNLIPLLKDRHLDIAIAAAAALGRIGGTEISHYVGTVTKSLVGEPYDAVIKAMVEAATPNNVMLLGGLVALRRPKITELAGEALRQIAFGQGSSVEDVQAFTFLARAALPDDRQRILSKIEDEDPRIRTAALKYVGKTGAFPSTSRQVFDAVSSADDAVMSAAIGSVSLEMFDNRSDNWPTAEQLERIDERLASRPDWYLSPLWGLICRLHKHGADAAAPDIFRVRASMLCDLMCTRNLGREHRPILDQLLSAIAGDEHELVTRMLFAASSANVSATAEAARDALARRIVMVATCGDPGDALESFHPATPEELRYYAARFALARIIHGRVADELDFGIAKDIFDSGIRSAFSSLKGFASLWNAFSLHTPTIVPLPSMTNLPGSDSEAILRQAQIERKRKEKELAEAKREGFFSRFRKTVEDLSYDGGSTNGPGDIPAPLKEALEGRLGVAENDKLRESMGTLSQLPTPSDLWDRGITRTKRHYVDMFGADFDRLVEIAATRDVPPADVAPVDQTQRDWVQSPDRRQPALQPHDIDPSTLHRQGPDRWIASVLENPWSLHAAKLPVSEIGSTSERLAQNLKSRFDIDSSQAIDLTDEYLGAACPSCSGGLTGEICLLLSALGSTKGTVADQQVIALLEGNCPHCGETEAILLWKASQ